MEIDQLEDHDSVLIGENDDEDIDNNMSIFTGETDTLPSQFQFPLTLPEEKEASHSIENYETEAKLTASNAESQKSTVSGSAQTPQSLTSPGRKAESQKSTVSGSAPTPQGLQSPGRSYQSYSNDSFFGGSTQVIQTPETPPKGNSPEPKFKGLTLDSEATELQSPLLNKESGTGESIEKSTINEAIASEAQLMSPLEKVPGSAALDTNTEAKADKTSTSAEKSPNKGRALEQSIEESATLHFGSEATDFITPTKGSLKDLVTLGGNKKDDMSPSPLGANESKELVHESLLDFTATPIDGLSYPRDHIDSAGHHDTDDTTKMSHMSSAPETLSTTPQSQNLLEPRKPERPSFSVADKFSERERSVRDSVIGAGINDDIANSSDEEDEIVNDGSPSVRNHSSVSRAPPSKKSDDNGDDVSKADTNELETKQSNNISSRNDDRYGESDDSDEETQLDTPNNHNASVGNESDESDEEASIRGVEKPTAMSGLEDTQPDDDDDRPLISLRRVRRGKSVLQELPDPASSSPESSDEENEFTDDLHGVEPSQATRDIKSQLQKHANFDIKTLTEKLMHIPAADNAAMKKQIKELSGNNKVLEKRNKQLEREKDSLRKKLLAVNAQLESKNVLLAEMKERLDEYQPLLEALQKIGGVSQPRSTSSTKSKKTSTSSRKKAIKSIAESEDDSSDGELPSKVLFQTPEDKKAAKQKANIVSVSNRKTKRKSSNRGSITFIVSRIPLLSNIYYMIFVHFSCFMLHHLQ